MGLSVIIIAKNESKAIRRCLESVKWAQEIIVFDSGSTDGTQAICHEYTTQVYETDWPGYGPQKARALAKATQTWVLNLDADEELSLELQAEIQALLQNPPANIHGFYLKHQLVFYGQLIRHAMGSGLHVDLFRRELAAYGQEQVHESLTLRGELGTLRAPLYHYSFKDVSAMLEKINSYSSLSASKSLQTKPQACHFKRALFSGAWMFFRSYVLHRGFLDGKAGLILAIYIAENSYYRWLKTVYRDDS